MNRESDAPPPAKKVEGHDFSRAEDDAYYIRALAPDVALGNLSRNVWTKAQSACLEIISSGE